MALMAEAEIGDLIVEVRSATAGVGSFSFKFDHMAELTGRSAEQVVATTEGGRITISHRICAFIGNSCRFVDSEFASLAAP